jgi:hypothetical protein
MVEAIGNFLPAFHNAKVFTLMKVDEGGGQFTQAHCCLANVTIILFPYPNKVKKIGGGPYF